ncbi:MAG: hypothetical protein ETSY1_34850 [Candidatus Entotheonella factor]|uniref:NmrA-like domain-containing protein n=1 Tax=Entotheonella factor TaxID=1429438 RepID=W4L9S7_ENTF1|nr:NmrA family NAD(P)-binding protein [Candidatus Entotheonella palauensis]ETW94445.1 MAG: hypothetical protein ETSY1_34850 [Candidatus Entotheonella factor]
MIKPKILVTSAAGHTGAPAVKQLLSMGFPVRAFVRRHDARSQALKNAGAEIFAGDLFDFRDLRNALAGVQRAYHCPPFAANVLHGTSLFALAAEEAKLEVVALMSAWNPHATHPSIFTRELWIAQNIARWMPSVDVIHVNPGLFAFTYFFGLPAATHLGMLMLPYGEGLNAPPSNEDVASVAASVVADPADHIGKRYRPTGPKLISPHDCAEILGRILGRKVRYRDVSTQMFTKAAVAQGFPRFEIAQIRHYAEELRAGAYAVGAPTDHVEQVCGRPAEDFEVTARRYVEHPELVIPGFSLGSKLNALGQILKTMLTKAPNLDQWEVVRGQPVLAEPQLAHHSEAWLATAEKRDLNLLSVTAEQREVGSAPIRLYA